MSGETIHVGTMNSYEKVLQAIEYIRLSKLERGEAALLGQLKALLFTSYWTALTKGIPLDIELDTLMFDDMGITIFHGDGSASAIAVKNGDLGRSHVLTGIGQVGLRAVSTAAPDSASLVRRALLWSSTEDAALDAEITAACYRARVIPIRLRSLESMCAGRDAVIASLEF